MTRKVIVNNWEDDDSGLRISRIIGRSDGCEGIDICRYEADPGSVLDLANHSAHIVSLLDGKAVLRVADAASGYHIGTGTHLYIPPSQTARMTFSESSSVIHASAPDQRAHGSDMLIHNERYLAPTRFILTPQYLSRRAFLNRDHTLVSRSGHRVAWFHTTMFDTLGLPPNQDGQPVFKMSYDYQTEVNVVYDVGNEASVRFANHPYRIPGKQAWSDWHGLDGQTTYYLNESAEGPEVEHRPDPVTGKGDRLRNRHEIFIAPGGHVSLCCLFDPGPTGLEVHQPGEYSSYAPVAKTIGTPEYQQFLAAVAAEDEMISALSVAQARNRGVPDRSSPSWAGYEALLEGALRKQQIFIDNVDRARRHIVEHWRIRPDAV